MKDLFQSEGRRVGWLLTEVERQTEDRLSPESRQHLLDEVACHLDAAIRARLELGMEPIEAEMEAVEAFGNPKAYIDDLLLVHENSKESPKQSIFKGDRRVMLTFAAASVFMSLCFLSAFKGAWHLMLGLAFSAPIFAYFSYKSRRVTLIPLAVATLGAFAFLDAGYMFTWHNLKPHGWIGEIPGWQADGRIAEDRQIVADIDPILGPLQAREALRLKYVHSDVQSARNLADLNAMLLYPVVHMGQNVGGQFTFSSLDRQWIPGKDWTVSFAKAGSLEEARKLWKLYGQPLLSELSYRKSDLTREADAISDAQAKSPISDVYPDIIETAVAIPVWFGLWAFINIVFGGLGRLMALRPTFGFSRKRA